MLGVGPNGATDSKGRVELYEKGYGKDAAGIAKEAISYGLFTLFGGNAEAVADKFGYSSPRQRF